MHALWGHAESESDIFAFDHTCGALLGSYQCMLLQFFALRICEFLVFRDLPWNLTEMVMEVRFLENSRIFILFISRFMGIAIDTKYHIWLDSAFYLNSGFFS